MRILVDYRPALRARTGVGEYIRRVVQAYTATHRDALTLFTSSWKDRPSPTLGAELRGVVADLGAPDQPAEPEHLERPVRDGPPGPLGDPPGPRPRSVLRFAQPSLIARFRCLS